MEEVILEGNQYIGIFRAEEKNQGYNVVSGRNEYWWEGVGTIYEKQIGVAVRFMFTASNLKRSSYLEHAIIHFEYGSVGGGYPHRSGSSMSGIEIKDQKSVSDLVLDHMYKEFLSCLEKKDFSSPIEAPSLDGGELKEAGVVKIG